MDVHQCFARCCDVFFAGSSVKRLMVLHHGLQMPLYFTYSCLTVAVDKFEKFTETWPKACGSATVTSMEECRTVASFVGCGGHYGWGPMAASEPSDLGGPAATLSCLGALRSSRPGRNSASGNSEADHAH